MDGLGFTETVADAAQTGGKTMIMTVNGQDMMHNMAIYERSNGKCHGYSKTSEKHLKEIFERIQHKEALRFLDIGCGKGVVLKEAAKYPFQRVDGIEIQPQLVKTAQKNFRILKIEDRIRCILADVAEFEKYGDYNLFFLFNPFPAEIFEKVIRKIMESRNDTDHIVTVIYHNLRFLSAIESNAKIMELKYITDKENRDRYFFMRKNAFHELWT